MFALKHRKRLRCRESDDGGCGARLTNYTRVLSPRDNELGLQNCIGPSVRM